ncbi:mitotic checkpoint serine/threonine-protein kinase BUB1 [Anastrepha obliqua]|uniref:mitotic checkpoint serine/threonine-protein kinase BUB1 n=1 Tax=Anastrepha obliqua TaxID=95512 RepID=UPI002409E9BC|nr:mitotic checkpoint serine/threonine-protein kinase BUB1 [Anastrepha obliqua]
MMNSCLPVLLPTDLMHGFLRDKQAWENAISMYQGPDPLDHWYNYICWYENHLRGDLENKFRETLERCLALFEHSEFYKQDLRMVRLWLKYIEMQTHPLHFYQVLYQRGVGRQVAAFYIGWAGYYQSINAIKEAESVYNLAFQEKAQSCEELHHAHNKFLYMQTAAAQMALHHQQQQHQPHLTGHQLTQHHQSQQMHYQQAGQCQSQNLSQHSQPPMQQQPQAEPQQSPQMHSQLHSPQLENYHRQQTSTAAASNSYYQPHAQNHIQVQQEQLYQQQVYQNDAANYRNETDPPAIANQFNGSTITVYHSNLENASETAEDRPAKGYECIEYEKATRSSTQMEEAEVKAAALNKKAMAPALTPVGACKLPRKFAAYCHNNYETWKPALFLEEPEDPNRRCHYAKQLVYPGTGVEYSPEELRAKMYITRPPVVNNIKQVAAQINTEEKAKAEGDHIPQELQEIGAVQKQQQHQDRDASVSNVERQHTLSHKHRVCTNEHIGVNGVEPIGHNFHNTIIYTQPRIQQHNHLERHIQSHHQNENPQQMLHEGQKEMNEIGNTLDDLEDQIEASTIRLGENKTIKIKFKKEPQQHGHTLKGNNYVIEGIYQQEVSAVTPSTPEYGRVKNGHSFHPYSIDNTSTPKSSSKRYKAKLKRINKIPIGTGSSSNSSSAENGGTTNGNSNAIAIEHIKSIKNGDEVLQNATFNDNANYSFSSAVALENSHCSLTSAVGRLNFRDSTSAYNTSTVADISTYQENSYFATQHDTEAKELRLRKAHEIIEHHLDKEAIDPFSSELCRAFLTKLDFPGSDDSCTNYKIVQTPLPKIANTRTLNLPDGVQFNIDKEVGRGSYGSVYKATDSNSGNVVALKFQKPPNTWEIYICDQVLKRIKTTNILPGLMDISVAVIAPNASIIATEFSPFGSLLDINNKIRQATTKVMHESLVMHFSAQICNIINHLHMNKIIHADIKPDNFLLMRIPSTDYHYPSLRLIDFGCAIDMTLFPEPDKTKFRKVIQTDGFTCIEMQEGRPWSYETDLFCIAGTVHVMLLGEYMQLQKRSSVWDIKQKLPRYLKKHVWAKFFNDMLNIKSTKLPDLNEMRHTFDQEAARMDSELQSQIRTLSNILHRR